jgi:hypothetical protein
MIDLFKMSFFETWAFIAISDIKDPKRVMSFYLGYATLIKVYYTFSMKLRLINLEIEN